MYFRKKQSGGRIYQQIVESRRAGDQVRQQVIATLGRLDELAASGQLMRLLRWGRALPHRRWCSKRRERTPRWRCRCAGSSGDVRRTIKQVRHFQKAISMPTDYSRP
jgi:hypothetical protein